VPFLVPSLPGITVVTVAENPVGRCNRCNCRYGVGLWPWRSRVRIPSLTLSKMKPELPPKGSAKGEPRFDQRLLGTRRRIFGGGNLIKRLRLSYGRARPLQGPLGVACATRRACGAASPVKKAEEGQRDGRCGQQRGNNEPGIDMSPSCTVASSRYAHGPPWNRILSHRKALRNCPKITPRPVSPVSGRPADLSTEPYWQ
jgi:hypothetical protein